MIGKRLKTSARAVTRTTAGVDGVVTVVITQNTYVKLTIRKTKEVNMPSNETIIIGTLVLAVVFIVAAWIGDYART